VAVQVTWMSFASGGRELRESVLSKNQVDKLKFILICFISLLSIGHRTIKMDATW
jgi:hypothetical protein